MFEWMVGFGGGWWLFVVPVVVGLVFHLLQKRWWRKQEAKLPDEIRNDPISLSGAKAGAGMYNYGWFGCGCVGTFFGLLALTLIVAFLGL